MRRKPSVIWLMLFGCCACLCARLYAEEPARRLPAPAEVKAAYLSTNCLDDARKIDGILSLIKRTELNAVVIDMKDSKVYLEPRHRKTIRLFKDNGIYVIGRIVVMQDSFLARSRRDLAVKTGSGELWYSGRKSWQRYWVDPASAEVLSYNIAVSKQAIDAGADELNFDYIRFPSDGRMSDMVYPVWDGRVPKHEVMRNFFRDLCGELKAYSPKTVLSIDVFGYVYARGRELGIGQRMEDAAAYFDVLAPMAYPSHYRCGEFGARDPNASPHLVYLRTLENGLNELKRLNAKAITRPWVQDFSLGNIYGCGQRIKYDAGMVGEELRAIKDSGLSGFMLWNVGGFFTEGALDKKK